VAANNNTFQKTYDEVDMLNTLIDGRLGNVNTTMPCKVISASGNKVTLQPLIQRIFIDENEVTQYLSYPEITEVPVLTLGSPSASITFPTPQAGDIGLFLINQNFSGDTYGSGETINPRKFSLLDGVFVPLYLASLAPANTIVLESEELKVEASSGVEINTPKFAVDNGIAELLQSIIDTLEVMKTGLIGGPNTFNPATQALITAEILKIQAYT
jgi:hypothetical protein